MEGTGWDLIASYYWRKYNLDNADVELCQLRHSQDNNSYEMVRLYRMIDVAQRCVVRDVTRPLSAVDYGRVFTN